MERRVRRKAPARCGSGEKAEVILSEPYLSTFNVIEYGNEFINFKYRNFIDEAETTDFILEYALDCDLN